MKKTRMWVFEVDEYGATDYKFKIEEPHFIPRIGELVVHDFATGYVDDVTYNYQPEHEYSLIVNVYLRKEK